jgi:hypothetical protein
MRKSSPAFAYLPENGTAQPFEAGAIELETQRAGATESKAKSSGMRCSVSFLARNVLPLLFTASAEHERIRQE